LETLKRLLLANPPPDPLSKHGDLEETAPEAAARKGHIEIVEYLIEIIIKNYHFYGNLAGTACDRAMEILKQNATREEETATEKSMKNSCLRICTIRGRDNDVEWLLDNGADPKSESYKRKTAWDLSSNGLYSSDTNSSVGVFIAKEMDERTPPPANIGFELGLYQDGKKVAVRHLEKSEESSWFYVPGNIVSPPTLE
jgi:ankyrin repeat protein